MESNRLGFGQYVAHDSFVHRRDARGKIVALVLLMVGVFAAKTWWHWGAWWIGLAVIAYSSKLGLRRVLKGAKGIIVLCLMTVVLNLFMVPGQELWSWGWLKITVEGIDMSLRMGQRLLLLVLYANFLTLTTTPMALSDGLEAVLSPLKLVKFPVHQMAMMMTIALRFIPTLMQETQRVMKAQIARGADLDSGGLIRRAKAFVPLLVPLFIIVFQRADELAQAMESRCYRGGVGRTRLKTFHWNIGDTVMLLAVAALVIWTRHW